MKSLLLKKGFPSKEGGSNKQIPDEKQEGKNGGF